MAALKVVLDRQKRGKLHGPVPCLSLGLALCESRCVRACAESLWTSAAPNAKDQIMKQLTGNIALALDQRRQLRRRAPVSIAIADRFSQLNAEQWREITKGQSLFHSAAYQRAFEQFRPSNLEPRYA